MNERILMSNLKKIYVGNLSYDVSKQDLEEHFSQYGEIEEAILIMDRDTGRSKGFGFITYLDQKSAESALAANSFELKSRPLKVNIAKERTEKTNRTPRW